jgi:hypothetical protein
MLPVTRAMTHHMGSVMRFGTYVFLFLSPWIGPLFTPRCIQNSAYAMSFIISSYSSVNIPVSSADLPYAPSLSFSPPAMMTFNKKSEDVPIQSKSRSENSAYTMPFCPHGSDLCLPLDVYKTLLIPCHLLFHLIPQETSL